MNNALADKLEIWGIEEELILFSDASLGFGLGVIPLDVSCFDDLSINSIAVRLGQFLNGLPEKTNIQFIQEITPDKNLRAVTENAPDLHSMPPVSQTLSRERQRFLANKAVNGLIPEHSLKILARKKMSASLFDPPKLFSKPKPFASIAEDRLSYEVESINRLKENLITELSAIGLNSKPLSQREVLTILYEQWNPGRPIDLGEVDYSDLRSSILFSDVTISPDGFSLGATPHRVATLKTLPDQTVAGNAQVLRVLPLGSRLFLSIYMPEQQKELESLQLQRRLAFSMAKGKTHGVADLESENKFRDLESLLSDMIAHGEKVFHASFHVVFGVESKNELDQQTAQILSTLREMNNAEGMVESLAAFDVFCACSFPNAKVSERLKKIKTSNLADLLPVYGPWRGHHDNRTGIVLRSRLGSIVHFDPFSSQLTNFNQVVSGASGSGKSVFANLLLLQMLKEDPQVFIIDIGGSYKRLCQSLNGQYISLGVDCDLSLNPFDLCDGQDSPDNSKIKFLVGLVEMMTKEDDQPHLSRLQRAEVEESIKQIYSKKSMPFLHDLRDCFLENSDREFKNLGKILNPWCGASPYGQFIDKPTTVHLNSSVVCFDLKGLESHPDLQAVCLFIITDFIWREIQKDRTKKKFLVFDECWKLLDSDAGSVFIAEAFRTFRKYFASAIAISQNLDDFAKSKASAAIFSNSSVKWLLMQKGADQARVKDVLQLNENEMDLVSSLQQKKGEYSEAFLIAGDNRCVVAIEPTPLEYWLVTTDPADIAEIQKASSQNPNLKDFEIIKLLADRYPHGMSQARSHSV